MGRCWAELVAGSRGIRRCPSREGSRALESICVRIPLHQLSMLLSYVYYFGASFVPSTLQVAHRYA